jgi:hypothetical protein
MSLQRFDDEWIKNCEHWHGKVLTGRYAHYCYEWDDLPVDETCPEFECCICFTAEELADPNYVC